MITKAAQDTTNCTKRLTFTRSARAAWKLIIESVKKDRGHANIMLPAYIGFTEREGSGIFDPVEATKADYSFYALNDDLSIDLQFFTRLAETGKFNIALIVHYFGFCRNDLDKIKSLCSEHNIILVEDCAHAFQLGLAPESLGVSGDFAFYSIHKHLATNTGGILRDISGAIKTVSLPEEDMISLEPALQLLNSDLEEIALKRRENFKHYARALRQVDGIEIMYEQQDDEVPQTFPIRVKNNLREPLYFYLMEKGMPTIALYYRMIDKLDVQTYPLAHGISNEILNLPVHQDITAEDIRALVKEIKNFMGGKQ